MVRMARDVYVHEEDALVLIGGPAYNEKILEQGRDVADQAMAENPTVEKSFQTAATSPSWSSGRAFFAWNKPVEDQFITRRSTRHLECLL